MCFYPVCIILRPAAALSAAARARLGPGSGSGCSASISGLADPTAGRGSCVWAEAEFINNPRPPLWGGGAFLSEDVNHPPPSPQARRVAPRLFPSGDRRGEGVKEGRVEPSGAWRRFSAWPPRGASPQAPPRRSSSGWDAGPWSAPGPGWGAGGRTGRGPDWVPACRSPPVFPPAPTMHTFLVSLTWGKKKKLGSLSLISNIGNYWFYHSVFSILVKSERILRCFVTFIVERPSIFSPLLLFVTLFTH